ncbi:DNA-binding protein [Frankia gtarii]|uniref:DNA-binding protein n=1 Tax=Frankia gtarii TaxID=2950102 RepID=UPI0021BF9F59|nr:DNA-binding protein [Frankia gtarii]
MHSPTSPENLRRLPLVLDLSTAAPLFGIGRTFAYELARADDFPCPVRRYGRLYRVRTADLLHSLGLEGNGWTDWQLTRLRRLPPIVDLPTAAKLFGLGRTLAYNLARADDFPCPVRRYGRLYRVRTTDLLHALGLTGEEDQADPDPQPATSAGAPRALLAAAPRPASGASMSSQPRPPLPTRVPTASRGQTRGHDQRQPELPGARTSGRSPGRPPR